MDDADPFRTLGDLGRGPKTRGRVLSQSELSLKFECETTQGDEHQGLGKPPEYLGHHKGSFKVRPSFGFEPGLNGILEESHALHQ